MNLFFQAISRNSSLTGALIEALHQNPSCSFIPQTKLKSIFKGSLMIIMRCVVLIYAEMRNPFSSPCNISIKGITHKMEIEGNQTNSGGFFGWQNLVQLFHHVGSTEYSCLHIPTKEDYLFQWDRKNERDEVQLVLKIFEGDRSAIPNESLLDVLRTLNMTAENDSMQFWKELQPEFLGSVYENLLNFQLHYVTKQQEYLLEFEAGSIELITINQLKKLQEKDLLNILSKMHFAERGSQSDIISNALKEQIHQIITLNLQEDMQDEAYHRFIGSIRMVHEMGSLVISTWTGSRKGSGSYYTNPKLIEPIIERTIEPLIFRNGKYIVPSEILKLKILDPAMGTGNFLVVVLRYLVSKLNDSIHFHETKQNSIESEGLYDLNQAIAENCIYGVDLDPIAVSISRLILGFEVRSQILLNFDDRIKLGNSLLGTTREEVLSFPSLAFERKTGDFDHKKRSIHFKAKQGYHKIRAERRLILKLLKTRNSNDVNLDNENVKSTYNQWNAIWFSGFNPQYSVESHLEKFESSFRNPNNFLKKPSDSDIEELTSKWKFFHWELEYPQVFIGSNPGFDAIVSNPPWENLELKTKEFFIKYDPLFLAYSNVRAESEIMRLFRENKEIEVEWLVYVDDFHSLKNYITNKSKDPTSKLYHFQGNGRLNTYKLFTELTNHLVKDQGRVGIIIPSGIYSDSGTKELRELLLTRCKMEWLFGFYNKNRIFNIHASYRFCIVIYSKGGYTQTISSAFMRESIKDWADLRDDESFLIQYTLYDIDLFSPFYKAFLELTDQKDHKMLRKIYENSTPLGIDFQGKWALGYRQGDFNFTNVSKQGLLIPWNTLDQNEFKSHVDFIDFGIIPYYINGKQTYLLPVYQGRSIAIGSFASQDYVSGSSNQSNFRFINLDRKKFISQFYITIDHLADQMFQNEPHLQPRIAFRNISNSTNARTFISALIPSFPTIHALPILTQKSFSERSLLISSILQSLVFDFCLRNNLSGVNITLNILQHLPMPYPQKFEGLENYLLPYIIHLNLNAPIFALSLIKLKKIVPISIRKWALTNHERLRIFVILNSIMAHIYELSIDEFKHILRTDKGNLTGFWRIDSNKPNEIRLTTLVILAYQRIEKIGMQQFLNEDWQFPESVQLLLGERFLKWQTEMTETEEFQILNTYSQRLIDIYCSINRVQQ